MNKVFSLVMLITIPAVQLSSAAQSVITVHSTAQINITANGEHKAYLCPDSIYVATGARLIGWGPEAVCIAKVAGAGDVSVPVVLSAFTASIRGNSVVLDWTTQSEQTNLGWNILRGVSQEGPFIKVNNTLVPGAGTIVIPQNYSFADDAVANGTWYYRLEQVDISGSKVYSQIISTSIEVSSIAANLPANDNFFNITLSNPTQDLSFNLDMSKAEKIKISVCDIFGNEIGVLTDDLLPAESIISSYQKRSNPEYILLKLTVKRTD